MTVVSMNNLLESGVHFGHETKRWNPKMKEYIFTSRDKIHIIDLQKTQKLIEEAYKVVFEAISAGGEIMFVGTKKQAQEATIEAAQRVNMPYMTERWLGGTLTNYKTIKQRIKFLEEIEKMEEDGTFSLLPKKEVIKLKQKYEKLNKNLCGVRNLEKMPKLLFVIDPRKELNAIKEARILGIPVIGIVDTNCDPDDVDYVIPANDDAIRAVKLVLGVMANAVAEAKGLEMVDYVTEDPNKVRNRNQNQNQGNRYNNDRRPARPTYTKPVVTEVKPEVVKVEEPKVAPVDYSAMTVTELKTIATEKGINGISKMKKAELIDALK